MDLMDVYKEFLFDLDLINYSPRTISTKVILWK